jgi:hypothetical protein
MFYRKINGDSVDLSGLTPEERAFFDRCYAAYRANDMPFDDFGNLVSGMENPLLRPTGGFVTQEVWDHPLWQAVRDLEDRVGLIQDELAPEPDLPWDRDPITDEPISVAPVR